MPAQSISPWDSLYLIGESLIPPCAIQQLLTFEQPIEFESFKNLSESIYEWDQSEFIFKQPLKNTRKPEIWVGKNQILFRVSHAVMDGRGSLIWMRQIFKSLQGESINPTDNRLIVQDLITHSKQISHINFPGITNSKKYFFQTKLIKNSRSHLMAKIASRIPEYFGLDSARIMIPVDLRRYVPEITHTGNLSAPIFLDILKNNSWQEIQQQLLSKLAEKQELYQDLSFDFILKHAPGWVIKTILNTMLKLRYFMAHAIISDLGKINLAEFSTSEIKAISFKPYPVHTGMIPLSIILADCGAHTEIVLSCSEGQGIFEKAKAFLDDLGGVLDFFETRVRKTPNQIAVICEDRELTYEELNQIPPDPPFSKGGNLISFSRPRTEQALIQILQILKSGNAYLPIDPDYPEERCNFILEDSQNCPPIPNLAYVLYTSGSTGTPKGVMVSHESLANYLLWARDFYQINSNTRFGLFTSLSFDLSVSSLFLSLLFGNGVEIFPGQFNIEQIQKIANSPKINALKLTPTHLEYFCRFELAENKFERIIIGGEQLTKNLAQKAQNLFGNSCQIYNEYGPTEATVGCVAHAYHDSESNLVVSIGKAIRGTQINLINNEIYISGDCLALGYLNQPELTQEKFVFLPNKTLAYRTGDLARFENGLLFYEGRVDNQLKIKGFRVEPAEIEEAILSHPEVKQAQIIGQDQMLLAYYVSDSHLDNLFLKNYLKQKLPPYLVPNKLEQVDEIAMAISGKAVVCRPKRRGKIQDQIAEILNIDPESITEQANFYDLGGDSLKMLELISELSVFRKLNQDEIRAIIASPTLAMLQRMELGEIRARS